MTRPLQRLVRAEKIIARRLKDERRYREWESMGKIVFQTIPMRARKKLKTSASLIDVMIRAQLNTCVLCGGHLVIDLSLRPDHPDRPSFDHVVCKAKGGPDRGNRIAAHRSCNTRKANRDPNGCELLWLAVVNLAIEKVSYDPSRASSEFSHVHAPQSLGHREESLQS